MFSSEGSSIDAIILCGGLGKRLRGVIGDHQKVMAATGGRPFLDVILENLKQQGIRRVILCTGYDADEVEDYYRKNPQGLEIVFSRESKPLGTGGAVKNAKFHSTTPDIFVLNGDCFCDVDLKQMAAAHRMKNAQITVAVSVVHNKADYGGVDVSPDGSIALFKEKDGTAVGQYANAGVYCFQRNVFDRMPAQDVFSLEYDFFPSLIGQKLFAFIVDKPFYDIGTPERFAAAQKQFKRL